MDGCIKFRTEVRWRAWILPLPLISSSQPQNCLFFMMGKKRHRKRTIIRNRTQNHWQPLEFHLLRVQHFHVQQLLVQSPRKTRPESNASLVWELLWCYLRWRRSPLSPSSLSKWVVSRLHWSVCLAFARVWIRWENSRWRDEIVISIPWRKINSRFYFPSFFQK